MPLTTSEIAKKLNGTLHGPGDITITGLNTVTDATSDELTFIGSEKYAAKWTESSAAGTLATTELVEQLDSSKQAVIVVDDVDLAMASLLEMFAPDWPVPDPPLHPDASVDPSATLAEGVCVGANAVVGKNTTIGARTIIHAGATILDDCVIGEDCVIFPGVVIRERCSLGNRVIIHPNTSIGADGFGYRPAADGSGLVKIPQIGTVEIHDDVEIGSNSCVDRAKFAATIVGAGTKIDNLVQIAHNCIIGRSCIIVGGANIAGSVTIGDGTIIGGMCAIADHIDIGAGATLAASSNVMNDIPAGQKVAGYPAREFGLSLRTYGIFLKLPEIYQRLRKLEKKLK